MGKISSLGNSGMGQIPPGWDDMATQETLFEPWPNAPGKVVGQLEPYGNPAYEGYGYPAAGYGQVRRQVVGLALPKAVNPQLVGWENPQPRGLKITPRGDINASSDRFTRGEISVLNGLGAFRGMGQVQSNSVLNTTTSEQIASWMNKGFPAEYVKQLTEKLIKDDGTAVAAWQAIQAIKKAGKRPNPDNVAAQQKLFGEVNNIKFWVLFFPEFQKSLGFLDGKPKVTPPNYDYIKSNPDSSLGYQIFDWMRQGVIGDHVKALMARGYVTGSLNGLGLGPVVLGVLAVSIAVPVSGAIYFYGKSVTGEDLRLKQRMELVDKEAKGEVPKGTVATFDGVITTADKAAGKIADAVTYAAIGISAVAGVGLVIYLINKFRG